MLRVEVGRVVEEVVVGNLREVGIGVKSKVGDRNLEVENDVIVPSLGDNVVDVDVGGLTETDGEKGIVVTCPVCFINAASLSVLFMSGLLMQNPNKSSVAASFNLNFCLNSIASSKYAALTPGN
ncbi:hypothetical protein PtrSN002B_000464 [Pyrenophora tritici-repentis]|uniref:TT-ORF1 multi-domain protein n=1 Tax=Pyrenophora tritici-repentis TaxID=45151 RepID=A0A2W1ERU7_9PLEO|nr:hypothetical protein PtrV1_00793 [Pyrenophora tritici-repentis]KAF7453510.1 hypothetical protein A1F99_007680 [Pyrenophora tritici-repentis]KAF7576588.1 TT-ORF1 multi-domain protein [Pyrenophora tritici-repentis]KAG9387264.1 hypothetical protein A1F94_000156 [Pyrenophora tritici-repentis]KAI1549504.1 hypothetical protein PtrSN001A_000805 [Pyrenophora tritici-repentis]